MDRKARVRRVAVIVAAAGALAYAASKVDFALTNQLGLPGFPVATSTYRAAGDITLAQLGNAGVGLAATLLALSLWRPVRNRWLRTGVHVVTWTALLVVSAGLLGFTARALGLADGLGPAARAPAAQLVLLVGALWILSWAVAARLHWSASIEPQNVAGASSSSSA